ncbi:MAG: hypothetical protein IPN58_02805 [Anaerolineales bacterium]|nr:hypothetical protein [Anaerolineales bacterium]
MTEQSILPTNDPKKNNLLLYVVIGAVILCCLCCAIGLVGQYLLESSNFSLVNIFRSTI